MKNKELRLKFQLFQANEEIKKLQRQKKRFKSRLKDFIESISDDHVPKYSGYYALFKFKDGKPEFLSIFNPDIDDPETEPEWNLCLPIPDPESMPEFMGW